MVLCSPLHHCSCKALNTGSRHPAVAAAGKMQEGEVGKIAGGDGSCCLQEAQKVWKKQNKKNQTQTKTNQQTGSHTELKLNQGEFTASTLSGGHQLFKASRASDVQLGIKKGCACSLHRRTRGSLKTGLLNTAAAERSAWARNHPRKSGNSWGI